MTTASILGVSVGIYNVYIELRRPWGFSPEARRGSQGASRAAPGKSGLHARGEGERVLALESREPIRGDASEWGKEETAETSPQSPALQWGGCLVPWPSSGTLSPCGPPSIIEKVTPHICPVRPLLLH